MSGPVNINQKPTPIKITNREPSDKKFIVAMFTPATIVFILGIAFPLILSFYLSITNSNLNHFIIFPPDNLFGNFLNILGPNGATTYPGYNFYQYFYQTVFFVVVSVGFELILGILFALIVNRKFFGRGFTRAALLVPWALPTLVSALVFRELFAPDQFYGLVNEFFKVIGLQPVNFYGDSGYNFGSFLLPIPQATFPFIQFHPFLFEYGMIVLLIIEIWKTTPFIALLILAALQTIPEDLYKAADIEGASAIEKFRYITFPLIKGPVLIAVLFRLIDAIRVYDSVIALNDSHVYSITVSAFLAWQAPAYGVASAIAIIELLMLVFFAILIFKMSKNRFLYALAAFLFLFDQLVSLGTQLITIFSNTPDFLWFVILIIFLAFILRNKINNVINSILELSVENRGVQFIYYAIVLITAVIVIILLVGVFIFGLSLIGSNYVVLAFVYLGCLIIVYLKYMGKIHLKTEKMIVLLGIGILIVCTILEIINTNILIDKLTIFNYFIVNTNSLLDPVITILLVGSFVFELYMYFKVVSFSKKVVGSKINPSEYAKLFYFNIIVQLLVIIIQLVNYTGFTGAGIIQSIFQNISIISISGLYLEFVSILGLFLIWNIYYYNSSEKEYDFKTFFGISILLELSLYIVFQTSIQFFIIINLLVIGSLSVFTYKSAKYSKSEVKKYLDLKIISIFLLLIIWELFLLFLQDTNTIVFGNFLILVGGMYFFRSNEEFNSTQKKEFNTQINQKSLRRRGRFNSFGFGFIVLGMLAFNLGPFLWMINRAFRNPCKTAGAGDFAKFCSVGVPQTSFELSPFLQLNTFGLQGFNIALNYQSVNLLQALLNGFLLSGLTALLVIIIGSFVAVILSKYHFRGEQYAVLLIFSMSSLPPIIIIIPYLIQINILKTFGLDFFGFSLSQFINGIENSLNFIPLIGPGLFSLDQGLNNFVRSLNNIPLLGSIDNLVAKIYNSANGRLLSLVLPYVAFNLPLGVFLIRSFFANIPDELIRAAKVDGASNFQVFRKILLPLTLPGIFTSGLMVFIQAWNELLFARVFLTGSPDSYTVPLALYSLLTTPSGLLNIPWYPNLVLATGSVIATLPLVILVLILQRYIISGITSGAVKG